jgi:hypothetical protein
LYDLSSDNDLKPMPKTKSAKLAGTGSPKGGGGRGLGVLLHLLGVIVFVGGVAYATVAARKYVDREAGVPDGPLKVVLKSKPAWMSDFLAGQIAATVPRARSSAFDHDLLVSAVAKLQGNPWVQKVHQVRRVYGDAPGDTLEVDCDFRSPVALVHSADAYWLVDNDGVKLPEQFAADELPKIITGRDGKMNIRVIDGVRQPAPEAGKQWVGQDLGAGLELVKLFYGKPFLEEVPSIDVSNFAGRVRRGDPQLVLKTRYGTQVWWGRPVSAKDFFVEVPVARKMQILEATVQQRGRVDAGKSYLDVRYEDYLVPSDTVPAEAGTREGR